MKLLEELHFIDLDGPAVLDRDRLVPRIVVAPGDLPLVLPKFLEVVREVRARTNVRSSRRAWPGPVHAGAAR